MTKFQLPKHYFWSDYYLTEDCLYYDNTYIANILQELLNEADKIDKEQIVNETVEIYMKKYAPTVRKAEDIHFEIRKYDPDLLLRIDNMIDDRNDYKEFIRKYVYVTASELLDNVEIVD